MARPRQLGRSRQTKQPKAASKKRTAEAAFSDPEDDQDIFGASDNEASDNEAAQQPEETAEEKRLQIAKAYLQQLRAEEAEGASDEEDAEALHGGVSARLRQQNLEALGQQARALADRLILPDRSADGPPSTSGRFYRCHGKPVTAIALTSDESSVFSVSKDGIIVHLDIETGTRTPFRPEPPSQRRIGSDGPEWVKKGARIAGKASLLAAAVSDDGRYLAVGGGDRHVHVFDARSHELVKSFEGHRDAITGVAFRQGTHDLFSCALDRTVKTWSIDDRMYVDTLFGHQAEVLAVDALRGERALTSGHDHTCRVWKIAEESQLICRASSMSLDCCRYVSGTEWLTGSSDGALALWTQFKKKPVAVISAAHPVTKAADALGNEGHSAYGWIQSVAACSNSDLAASGAGDGSVRLWAVKASQGSRPDSLEPLGQLPAPGFVNGLQIANSGRFLVAGLGQEPRLGRWARSASGRNGILIHKLELSGT